MFQVSCSCSVVHKLERQQSPSNRQAFPFPTVAVVHWSSLCSHITSFLMTNPSISFAPKCMQTITFSMNLCDGRLTKPSLTHSTSFINYLLKVSDVSLPVSLLLPWCKQQFRETAEKLVDFTIKINRYALLLCFPRKCCGVLRRSWQFSFYFFDSQHKLEMEPQPNPLH